MRYHLAAGLMVASLIVPMTASDCRGQTAPSLPPGVQDVVKLVKAGMDDEVVLAQIRNGTTVYNLSVDQIIYLHDQGVSQNVIKALLATGSASAPASPAPAPAPLAVPQTAAPVVVTPPPVVAATPVAVVPGVPAAQPLSLDSFQAQLAPFGTWMDVPGFGLCWRPAVAVSDPYWRPYCDQGHWVYTADGWFWQSEYPWGDIVFHYGRWFRGGVGWVWVPGYDWAPAWVTWRHTEGFCGWAPLPPGAVFKAGVGLWFGGRLAVDVDFGLGEEMFVFVPYDHFWDRDLRAFLLPRDRVRFVFHRSVIMNGYRFDHGRFVIEGLGRERIGAFTHREVRVEERGLRWGRGHEEVDRHDVRDDHRDDHHEDHKDRR